MKLNKILVERMAVNFFDPEKHVSDEELKRSLSTILL
jgi:hypothetical protein